MFGQAQLEFWEIHVCRIRAVGEVRTSKKWVHDDLNFSKSIYVSHFLDGTQYVYPIESRNNEESIESVRCQNLLFKSLEIVRVSFSLKWKDWMLLEIAWKLPVKLNWSLESNLLTVLYPIQASTGGFFAC